MRYYEFLKEDEEPNLPGAVNGVKVMSPEQFAGVEDEEVDEATKLPAQSRELGGQEFQDYMTRIKGTPDIDKKTGEVKRDKKGIDKYVKLVVEQIKKLAKDISSQDQIKQVATISANSDAEVGELISTAIEKVGREGIVTIEESKTGETSLEIVEGMQIGIPMILSDIPSFQRFGLPKGNYCGSAKDFIARIEEYRNNLSFLVVPKEISKPILSLRSTKTVGDSWENLLETHS